jgi:hypothetical protein
MGWASRAMYVAGLSVALALASGCARQATIQGATGNSAGPQLAPFGRFSPHQGFSPTASLEPASVPVGTLFSIRMESAVSSASAQAEDSFHAILEAPLVVQGQVIAPAGSAVSGRVVSARSSTGQDDPGYLRLTLTSVSIHGTPLLLQTSSLFAKGSSSPGVHQDPALALVGAVSRVALGGVANPADVEIPAGRELTFRLTKALPLRPLTSLASQ